MRTKRMTSKSVKTNPMTNKTNKLKSRLVRFLMDGMMSSSTSGMIINSKKSWRKKQVTRSNSLSRSQKTRTGGGLSEISSIKETSSLRTNNLRSLTESEAVKWLPKPSLLPITRTNFNTTIPCLFTLIHPAKEISCLLNGNKWKSTKFLTDYSAAE